MRLEAKTMKPLGLYIHLPFCPYRCHYCDFPVVLGRRGEVPAYVAAVIRDLKQFSKDLSDRQVISIFLGGGTPSLLSPSQVEEILDAARTFYKVAAKPEISLEANPDTLTLENLTGYRQAGVNRLSLGIQALQDRHLARMGRHHSPREAEEAFRMARQAGFLNLNVDLLFGLPDQSLEEWEETLYTILAWEPEHLSAYGLQVEEGTAFWEDHRKGKLPLPPEDVEAEMYRLLLDALPGRGYEQYEISNFARPGFFCRHNSIYWNNGEYLGVGIGAVSYLDGKRFWMTRDFRKYVSGEETVAGQERLPREGEMGETIMLGLRLRQGVSLLGFQERFHEELRLRWEPVIEKYKRLDLLEVDGDYLRLTRKGIRVSNEILQAFLPPGP